MTNFLLLKKNTIRVLHFLKRVTWQIKIRSRCHMRHNVNEKRPSEIQIHSRISFSMRSRRHFCRFSLTSFSASLDCSWAALSYSRWGNEPHVVSRFIRRADDRPQRDERPAFLSPYSVRAKTSLFVRAVRAIKIIVRERVRISTRARATLLWERERNLASLLMSSSHHRSRIIFRLTQWILSRNALIVCWPNRNLRGVNVANQQEREISLTYDPYIFRDSDKTSSCLDSCIFNALAYFIFLVLASCTMQRED